MEKNYGFKKRRVAETLSRIAKDGAADFRSRRRSQSRLVEPIQGFARVITVQGPAGGIPAATNYTFGMADCAVMVNDDGTWKDTGTIETVYNPSIEAQLTDGLRLGWAAWDGSQYVLISELCNDDRTFVTPEAL